MHDIMQVVNSMEIKTGIKDLVFSALFNNSPLAVYWMDRNGYQLGCNEVELQILNLFRLEEFTGRHGNDLYHPSAWQNSKKIIEANQNSVMEEGGFPDAQGDRPYFLSIKAPMRDKFGRVTGLIGVSLDITAQKQKERALQLAKEQAEAQLIAKEDAERAHREKSASTGNALKDLKEKRYYLKNKYSNIYFTQREAEYVICLARGGTSKQIAAILGLSNRTVETIAENLKMKLNYRDRADLISIAIECGFLESIRAV